MAAYLLHRGADRGMLDPESEDSKTVCANACRSSSRRGSAPENAGHQPAETGQGHSLTCADPVELGATRVARPVRRRLTRVNAISTGCRLAQCACSIRCCFAHVRHRATRKCLVRVRRFVCNTQGSARRSRGCCGSKRVQIPHGGVRGLSCS